MDYQSLKNTILALNEEVQELKHPVRGGVLSNLESRVSNLETDLNNLKNTLRNTYTGMIDWKTSKGILDIRRGENDYWPDAFTVTDNILSGQTMSPGDGFLYINLVGSNNEWGYSGAPMVVIRGITVAHYQWPTGGCVHQIVPISSTDWWSVNNFHLDIGIYSVAFIQSKTIL